MMVCHRPVARGNQSGRNQNGDRDSLKNHELFGVLTYGCTLENGVLKKHTKVC